MSQNSLLRSAAQLVLTTPRTKRRSGGQAFVAIAPISGMIYLFLLDRYPLSVFKDKLKEYLLALAFRGIVIVFVGY